MVKILRKESGESVNENKKHGKDVEEKMNYWKEYVVKILGNNILGGNIVRNGKSSRKKGIEFTLEEG